MNPIIGRLVPVYTLQQPVPAASQDVVAPFAKNFAVGDSSRSRLRRNGPHPRPPWLV